MVEKVGIGQLKVLKGRGILCAYGLGSCIGLFLYDRTARVGGLAHIMLPGEAPEGLSVFPYKYGDNAIDAMVRLMEQQGAERRRIGGVLIGGAHMFHDSVGDYRDCIGQKNISGVLQALKFRSLPILAEDVGGDYGRTVEANVEDGTVKISSFRHEPKEIRWIGR